MNLWRPFHVNRVVIRLYLQAGTTKAKTFYLKSQYYLYLLLPHNFNIMCFQGGVTILNHYKGSFKRAVMDLFPEIGLKEHLFENASSKSRFELGFLTMVS